MDKVYEILVMFGELGTESRIGKASAFFQVHAVTFQHTHIYAHELSGVLVHSGLSLCHSKEVHINKTA